MRQICNEAADQIDKDGMLYDPPNPTVLTDEANTTSVAMAAAHIAEEERVSAIASLSYSGETVRLISNRRPRAPIICVTTLRSVARRMGLLWGVTGLVLDSVTSTDETIEQVKATLIKDRILTAGSTVIFTIGRPLIGRARTNMLSIETLDQPGQK